MVVKKLKYDFHGNNEETVVKVFMDSKGMFSADIPMYVRHVCSDTVTNCTSLMEAIDKCDSMHYFYKTSIEETKRVILIEFKLRPMPFCNEGISLQLNFVICDKVTFGNSLTYYILKKENGEYIRIGNMISNYKDSNIYSNQGVTGESLELEYTEEKIKTIEALNEKLHFLADRLKDICNSEKQFMKLVSGTFNLLS